jgi:hypothetical protein
MVPVEFRDDFARFCQTGSRTAIDQSPFPRMVDLWFLAVCVASRMGLKPIESSRGATYKIIDGSIFSNDPWRIHALMLVASATAKSINVVGESRRMLGIANGLAIAGLPRVMEMLKNGDAEPIWNISDALNALLREKEA